MRLILKQLIVTCSSTVALAWGSGELAQVAAAQPVAVGSSSAAPTIPSAALSLGLGSGDGFQPAAAPPAGAGAQPVSIPPAAPARAARPTKAAERATADLRNPAPALKADVGATTASATDHQDGLKLAAEPDKQSPQVSPQVAAAVSLKQSARPQGALSVIQNTITNTSTGAKHALSKLSAAIEKIF